MLNYLELKNIGPVDARMDLAKRLNIITGDNGLGKSFLLDVAWWALTQKWPIEVNPKLVAGRKATPLATGEATIGFGFTDKAKKQSSISTFVRQEQHWKHKNHHPVHEGIVFYGMADGSFAIQDSKRSSLDGGLIFDRQSRQWVNSTPSAYVLSPVEAWNGLQGVEQNWLCNGLIRDWAGWQKEKGEAFSLLCEILAILSPSPEETIAPGALTRISLEDVRDMPTIKMPYQQEVPVVYASSGLRRILVIAYFLVWCWEEHQKAAKLLGQETTKNITFLIDEVESHLHPKWQRRIIPTLLQGIQALNKNAKVQVLAVTHSPLVMASLEAYFEEKQDAWFDLDFAHSETGALVSLDKKPFLRKGEASAWLISDAFGLPTARSLEAEEIIKKASTFFSEQNNAQKDKKAFKEIDTQLRKILGDTDPFWIRWRYIGEKQGWLS
jgi:predicted ATPase